MAPPVAAYGCGGCHRTCCCDLAEMYVVAFCPCMMLHSVLVTSPSSICSCAISQQLVVARGDLRGRTYSGGEAQSRSWGCATLRLLHRAMPVASAMLPTFKQNSESAQNRFAAPLMRVRARNEGGSPPVGLIGLTLACCVLLAFQVSAPVLPPFRRQHGSKASPISCRSTHLLPPS